MSFKTISAKCYVPALINQPVDIASTTAVITTILLITALIIYLGMASTRLGTCFIYRDPTPLLLLQLLHLVLPHNCKNICTLTLWQDNHFVISSFLSLQKICISSLYNRDPARPILGNGTPLYHRPQITLVNHCALQFGNTQTFQFYLFSAVFLR